MTFGFLFVAVLAIKCVFGINGIDAAGSVISVTDYECLKKDGYTFMITRAWESLGHFDPDAPQNLRNAQAAGYPVSNTSVYFFPCASTSQSAKAQMQTMIQSLDEAKVEYNMIWLDIEENPSSGCSWSKNSINTNCDIILAAGNTAVAANKTVGIYSNYNEWTEYIFFGDSGACAEPAKSGWPLWYADYDYAQNFNDFERFGGWTKPVMKQYAGDRTVCGKDVDLNWAP
mmetsp:Transcript_85296/g.104602  ORF Transcript_85296/g.104602 Transcript_85296/m.104602 type:complete len:229 (+) Transcript_85296:366-1052(+)